MRVLIVGGGKLVYFLSRALISKKHRVTVIDRNWEGGSRLAKQLKIDIVYGDGSDPEVLEDAGAFYSDVLLALTSFDQDNFAICQMADAYFQVPRILALVNDPDNEKVFKNLGIADAISTTHILTGLIEQKAIFEDIVHLTPVGDGKFNLTEVVLKKNAKVANIPLEDLKLPADCLIAGLIRRDKPIIPRGKTRLRPGDRIILVSLPTNHDETLKMLTMEY